MKAVVAAFNQEKALVGAFSVIVSLRMELFEALLSTVTAAADPATSGRAEVAPCGLPPLQRETSTNTQHHLGSFTATTSTLAPGRMWLRVYSLDVCN